MVYALLALAVVVVLFFVLRKPKADALPPKAESPKLPEAKSVERVEKAAEPSAAKVGTSSSQKQLPAETMKSTPVAKREEERARQVDEEKAASSPPPKAPEKPKPVEEDFGRAAPADPILVRKGLARTRGGFIGRLADLLRGKREIDPALLSQIEEILLGSDVGVKTSQLLIERLHERLANKELNDEEKVWAALRSEAQRILGDGGRMKLRDKPTVVMMVGVNGSGKTTTIGKLASKLRAQGKKVLLGAGDTFRAAAVQQLAVWAEREGAEIVTGKEGADPAGVLFEAVQKAKDTNVDVVLCDTAGRLGTKVNLMEELSKVHRSIGKAMENAPHEVLLVLDATNGQNALAQAKQFQEKIPITGVVLTKLDGTAKGGVILAIADELKVPVRYIGIGERAADLREFDAAEFVEALFSSRDTVSNEAA
jgi:fused signal recognition particle receptor